MVLHKSRVTKSFLIKDWIPKYLLGCPNSPEMLSPSPLWNLRFFGGFVPIIPQNIRLSPTQRFPNFPHLSSYFLVPKNWGKLGNPHFSPIIPKSCIFQKKFLFSAFFRPPSEYQWPLLDIFCHFYYLKGSKKCMGQ